MLGSKRASREASSRPTSLIARDTVVRGDICFSGNLHVEGQVEGALISESDDAVLTLSEGGWVQGEIRVAQAMLDGRVEGNVRVTHRLELAAHACITGDVHYQLLEMAAGAQVNGRMLHVGQDDMKQAMAALGDESHGEPVPA